MSWQETPVRLALTTAAAAIAGAVVETVGVNHTANSALYVSSPAAKVQMTVFVCLWAVTPTVWVIGRQSLHTVTSLVGGHRLSDGRHRFITVGVAVLVATAAGVAGAFARGADTGLYLGLWRTMATYGVATSAAYPALLTMWRAWRALAQRRVPAADQVASDAVPELLTVRWALVTALGAAGTLVSIGVFATGAQRQAWIAYSRQPDSYPPELVVVTGLLLTLFLAVNFIPGWTSWHSATIRELETRLPSAYPPQPAWRERAAERQAYAELLQLPQNLRDVASSAVVVLGPLLSAAVSLFLPSRG
ncbi:hypothetical protein [Terrabacter aerolatus]|uniref:hypothetical protein n=1 Tax=Terrabacter aerolatus TaxID=422442 RepID=UPI001649E089